MEGSPHYQKEERPWGMFERFTLNEPSTVKIITVHTGEALSLQTHAKREEFWRIISGSGKITIGEKIQDAKPGDTFFVPAHTAHRMEATNAPCVFLEIAYGAFEEEDIKRLEDKYGRA